MSNEAVGLVGLVLLILFFLTGIELAFAMAIIGFVGFAYLINLSAACNLMVKDFFDTFTNYGFTVIPLFILMGQLATNSSMAKRIYLASHKFFGHVPGGLAMTTVVGSALFKAMCGSSLATAATFSSIAVPEMNRYGYNQSLSTGVVASTSTLGALIPPSIILMIFGLITEESIGRLFLAGIFPGLIIAVLFLVIIFGWVKIDPSIAPKAEKASWGERIRVIPEFIWVGIIFFGIIGGLMFGWFSPTEAGSMGTIGVIILAASRRELGFKMFVKSIDESLRTACMTLILMWGSSVLGHFLAVSHIPFIAADWVSSLPMHRSLIMVLIFLVYLIGGSFIDDVAFMILATPIFFPAVIKLGYDPIWFGVMIATTVMIGIIIPPVAIAVFIVRNITGVPFNTIYKGVLPFLIALFGAMALFFIFPQIALWLPSKLMGV